MVKRSAPAGFTLIELIITVAIAGILAAIAVPSFSSLIRNNRLATSVNDLKVDLALARSESSKRGYRVTVCSSSTGTGCTATGWNSGRIVFVDRGTAGAFDTGTDEILRVTGAMPTRTTLAASTFASTAYVQFRPTGITDSTGTFKLCDDRTGNFGRTIAIGTTGRANLTTNVACP